MEVTFRKTLDRSAYRQLAEEFPRPTTKVALVPITDAVLKDFMGSDFLKKQDEQLAKIQASVNKLLHALPLQVSGLSSSSKTSKDQKNNNCFRPLLHKSHPPRVRLCMSYYIGGLSTITTSYLPTVTACRMNLYITRTTTYLPYEVISMI